MTKHKFLLYASWLTLFGLVFPAAWSRADSDRFSVVIDPGHGGSDTGTFCGTAPEKDFTLNLARGIVERFQARPEEEVTSTRLGDYPVSFDQRRNAANSGSLFISLHCSNRRSPKTPITVYLLPPPPPTAIEKEMIPFETAHGKSFNVSWDLARSFGKSSSGLLPPPKAVVARWPLTPLLGTIVPAVLIEFNLVDTQWTDNTILEDAVDMIISSIDRYRANGIDRTP